MKLRKAIESSLSGVVQRFSGRSPATPIDNDTFCPYPFVHLSTVPAGFTRPCCYFTRMLRRDDGRNYSIANDSLREIWNSSDLRDIRKRMINGEPISECSQCVSEEKLGKTSMRARALQEWAHRNDFKDIVSLSRKSDFHVSSQPKFLELKPGSLCNLKCRMCNQFDSSKVASEMVELAKKYQGINGVRQARLFDTSTFEVDFDISRMPDWDKKDEFWAEIEELIPHLEVLSLAGGEPTLLKKVHQFLSRCVEMGYSKNIQVLLATNFTRIDQHLLSIAEKFKAFEFIGSIDGTDSVQEFIRFPSKWQDVKSNFEQTKTRMKPGGVKVLVNLTLQLYNILSFTKVLDWLEELDLKEPHFFHHPYHINILHYPRYLSYTLLPSAGRKIAIERIDAYLSRSQIITKFPELCQRFELIKHELAGPTPEDYKSRLGEFWGFSSILDEHRLQSLADADPELFQIVSSEVQRLGLCETDLVQKNI